MKKRRPQAVIWKRLLTWAALSLALIGVGSLAYCWYLSTQIETRFSARLWSIPSRVFSDITLVYPGQHINRTLWDEGLRRLGYREVSHRPECKGEMRVSPSVADIFLHDLQAPSRKREGFPVQIRFSQDKVESIARLDNGEPLAILELEPEEIALFFGPERERRQLVSIDQVPERLIFAVLAAEDNRFYRHHGFDPKGTLRALYTNLRHGSIRQGGSTITQQLAKSYFLTPKRTLRRKAKELLMSLTMEVMYDKSDILEIYLNEIYLGQNASVSINGVGEASYFYFGKPVTELSLAEAAVIAGLIRGPNYYSPRAGKNRSRDRRNTVLRAMYKHGWISEAALQSALTSPIETVDVTAHGKRAPYFIDYLSKQLTTLYSPEVLSSLGLCIYTTLDTHVQMTAERALSKGLARLEKLNPALGRRQPEKKLQGAIIVMQPKTGYILAMVGGRDYATSQFNRITQAQRQPGSAFKPFVFVSALDAFTPASMLSNEPKSYAVEGKTWQPQNYEPIPEKRVRLRDALARSVNLATVDLAMQIGLDHIVDTAKAFRFSTPVKPLPSLSLGAFELIPLELARAYCAFAADGVLPYPLSLKGVLDENGQVLERRHMSIERAISPAKAFIMSSILRSAVRSGTARSLNHMGISFPVAGKTGTTNDYRDAWFIGYTPDILALVWVGFDHGDAAYAAGSAAALPIWAEFMKAIPQHISGNWFQVPPGVVRRIVCSQSGQLAFRRACPEPIEEFFLADNVPEGECPIHQRVGRLHRIIREFRDVIRSF
jgi:penicillin-binding protein 1B